MSESNRQVALGNQQVALGNQQVALDNPYNKKRANPESYLERELTTESDIKSDIFLQDNISRPFNVTPHWHDCFEILFVIKGSAMQTLNQQKFLVKENDLIIIKRGDVHSTFCEPGEDVKIIVIKFLPEFIYSIYSHSFESIYITSFLNINISPVKNLDNSPYLNSFCWLVNSLLDEFTKKELSFEIAIKGYLSVLISILVRLDMFVIPEILVRKSQKQNNSLTALLNYIEINALKENFNLNDVAKNLNFNYSYCSRYFKKNTGKGFHEFLTYIRICEAERKLLNENRSITQAALETGFGNSSVFSKAYKRMRGYSPNHLINIRKI